MKTKVNSSTIDTVDFENNVLRITFKSGGTYEYSGVPVEVVTDMLNAHSVGSFFAKNIRNTYKGIKIN